MRRVMTKRQMIAGVLLLVGALLMIGAFGTAEFEDDFGRGFITRTIIGLALVFAAIPVSGDLAE